MRLARPTLALCMTLFLAACGGSDVGEVVDGSALARPQSAAPAGACDAPVAGAQQAAAYQWVNGECVRAFAPLRSKPVTAVAPKVPQAAAAFTWAGLLAWAEQAYPAYFRGGSQDGTYQDFAYRYYPATGNYIGLRNGDMIYVLGPINDGDLLYVGTLGNLLCQADPASCGGAATTPTTPGNNAGGGDVPGSSATPSRLQIGSALTGTIDTAGDTDWHAVTLVAGTAYTFELQGASTSQGTLSDPILRLLNSAGLEVASNDDISYPSNTNSRIAYTPGSSGTYYLSAQAYDSLTGSYRLAASAGAAGSTGTGVSTGTGSGTGSTGTGGTTSGSGGIRIAPSLRWEMSVTPSFYTYVLKLCYGESCDGLGDRIIRDINLNDRITSTGFANGIRWSATSPVQTSALDTLRNGLQSVIAEVWANRNASPTGGVVANVLNTALANGTSPTDVISRARAGFTRAGYLGGTSGGGSGSGSTGAGSGGVAACTIENYRGPNDDPQFDSFCKNAYINQCLDQATGTSTYRAQTSSVCNILSGMLQSTGGPSLRSYCSYCP